MYFFVFQSRNHNLDEQQENNVTITQHVEQLQQQQSLVATVTGMHSNSGTTQVTGVHYIKIPFASLQNLILFNKNGCLI